MTLAFEDADSKLLDVVNAADVDAEECVDSSLVESLVELFYLVFGHNIGAEV